MPPTPKAGLTNALPEKQPEPWASAAWFPLGRTALLPPGTHSDLLLHRSVACSYLGAS